MPLRGSHILAAWGGGFRRAEDVELAYRLPTGVSTCFQHIQRYLESNLAPRTESEERCPGTGFGECGWDLNAAEVGGLVDRFHGTDQIGHGRIPRASS
jgi:hypothetical protein